MSFKGCKVLFLLFPSAVRREQRRVRRLQVQSAELKDSVCFGLNPDRHGSSHQPRGCCPNERARGGYPDRSNAWGRVSWAAGPELMFLLMTIASRAPTQGVLQFSVFRGSEQSAGTKAVDPCRFSQGEEHEALMIRGRGKRFQEMSLGTFLYLLSGTPTRKRGGYSHGPKQSCGSSKKQSTTDPY